MPPPAIPWSFVKMLMSRGIPPKRPSKTLGSPLSAPPHSFLLRVGKSSVWSFVLQNKRPHDSKKWPRSFYGNIVYCSLSGSWCSQRHLTWNLSHPYLGLEAGHKVSQTTSRGDISQYITISKFRLFKSKASISTFSIHRST